MVTVTHLKRFGFVRACSSIARADLRTAKERERNTNYQHVSQEDEK